jgi:hypothetical protein
LLDDISVIETQHRPKQLVAQGSSMWWGRALRFGTHRHSQVEPEPGIKQLRPAPGRHRSGRVNQLERP